MCRNWSGDWHVLLDVVLNGPVLTCSLEAQLFRFSQTDVRTPITRADSNNRSRFDQQEHHETSALHSHVSWPVPSADASAGKVFHCDELAVVIATRYPSKSRAGVADTTRRLIGGLQTPTLSFSCLVLRPLPCKCLQHAGSHSARVQYGRSRSISSVRCTPPVAYKGIAISCKRKVSHLEQKIYCPFHDEESQFHAVHQLSDGCHQDDEEEELVVWIFLIYCVFDAGDS